jgi:Ran GTPase-activating protein (RanGAP) involved in mRNA processing and transport
MKLPMDVMQLVAQSIQDLKKLEYLNLSGNTIDKECGTILADSLKELELLKTFIMRDCEIDSDTFSEIAKSLSSLPIVNLCIGNNHIKDNIKSIPVKNMPELRFVDLANNELTFDMLVSFLSDTIGHEKLQVIDCKNNRQIYETTDSEGTKVDTPTEVNAKRDKIEEWKLKNKSKIAVFMECSLPIEVKKKVKKTSG